MKRRAECLELRVRWALSGTEVALLNLALEAGQR